MGILGKLASLINGTAPSDISTTMENIDGESSYSTQKNEPHDVSSEDADNIRDAISINDISDKMKNNTSLPRPETALFRKGLGSGSLSEQRYTWHKYLVDILSNLRFDDPSTLKHFTIYICKVANYDYKWNDDTFKAELKQALELYERTSHIGSSTLSIEIVLEKEFHRIADKVISDTQFKTQVENIILFGSKKETDEQKFATAIDKRAFVINEFLKKFRSSTGTDSTLMENLVIIVVRNEEDDDMAQYDWVGKRFEEDLKRELTNAFLDKIGSKSLQVILKPKSETDGCISLIENHVYYKWGKTVAGEDGMSKEIPYERVIASVSILEGSGSMIKHSYNLDSDIKKIYHIGRGIASRKDGKYRINDIVINDKETAPELLQYNLHVSSAHADIVFKNNKYYLRAAVGGCRALGGSPTKIVRSENVTEVRNTTLLYPLEDGDILELGKNVLLVFSLSDDRS